LCNIKEKWSMREVKICPQCQAENRAEARFCTQCGRSLAAITPTPAADVTRPEIDAVRWQPRQGEIAARIQQRDLPSNKHANLIIEDNTLAVILRDGVVQGQQGPGRYQLQSLAEHFLGFGQQPEVAAVLIDSGELSLEFTLNDLWTLDPLRLSATCRLAVQVGDAQRFIRSVLKDRLTFTVADLRQLLYPELYDAAQVYVGDHSIEQLEGERKARRDDFGVDVQERLRDLFEQSGIAFKRVQMLDLRHPRIDALRGQEEELFLGPAEFDLEQRQAAQAYERQVSGLKADQQQRDLELQRLRQEFAHRQRLSAVTNDEELHKIALEEAAAAQHEQRSQVWDRLRRAIQQDKLNEATTQEEWDKFVAAADRRRLLREDELKQVRDGLRWSDEDRQKERAQLIAMAELQSQYERKAAELASKLKHDRAALQSELTLQRETILGRLDVRAAEVEAQLRVDEAERRRQAQADQAQRAAAAAAAQHARDEQAKADEFQRQQGAKSADSRRQDEHAEYTHRAGMEDDSGERARKSRAADAATDINIQRQQTTADNDTVLGQAKTAAEVARLRQEREAAADNADLDLAAKAMAMLKENQAAKQRMQREDEEERRRIARQDELARQDAILAAEKERLQAAITAEKERQMLDLERRAQEQQHELARMKAMGELSAEALIALAPVQQAQILAELRRTEQLKNLSEDQILALAVERNPAVVELLKAKADAAAEGKLQAAEAAKWQALSEERTRHETELRQQIEAQQAAQMKLVQEAAARESQAAREAIERAERMANSSAERTERMASDSAARQAQSSSDALRAVSEVARSFAQNQPQPASGPTVILPPGGSSPSAGATVIGGAGSGPGSGPSVVNTPAGGGEWQVCPKCRVKMPVGEKFCSNCGHQFFD
jgi:hypothetical protein